MSFFFFSSRSCSSTMRRLTTTLRRRLFFLMMRHSISWPMNSSRLGTWRRATWEPGRNVSTPQSFTTRPPLIRRSTMPCTISLSSCAFLILSQTFRKSARSFESATRPSWFSSFSRNTSNSSPGLSSCSPNSSMEMTPSLLKPMLSRTSLSRTSTTVPRRILPSATSVRVSSYVLTSSSICSAERSSSFSSSRKSSLMMLISARSVVRRGATSSARCAAARPSRRGPLASAGGWGLVVLSSAAGRDSSRGPSDSTLGFMVMG